MNLDWHDIPPGSVVAVVGMPGSGKSRAVQLADADGAFPRRVVFDPYVWRHVAQLRHTPNAPVHPWTGTVLTPRQLILHPEVLDASPLKVVVGPIDLDTRSMGRDFNRIAELVWSTGHVDLIAEESGLYGRHAVDLVMRFASGGRHAGARFVLLCQSISRLPIDARRHLTHVVAHAQGEPSDLDDLRGRCGPEFAARVQRLRVGDAPHLWRQGDATHQESRK